MATQSGFHGLAGIHCVFSDATFTNITDCRYHDLSLGTTVDEQLALAQMLSMFVNVTAHCSYASHLSKPDICPDRAAGFILSLYAQSTHDLLFLNEALLEPFTLLIYKQSKLPCPRSLKSRIPPFERQNKRSS
jgi:hypothetical protein